MHPRCWHHPMQHPCHGAVRLPCHLLSAKCPAHLLCRPTAEQVVEDLRQQLMAMRPAPHAAPPRPPLRPHVAPAPAAQQPEEAA